MIRHCFVALMLAIPLAAQTPPLPVEKDWQTVCQKASAGDVPKIVYTHDEAWLKACDATALYYGFSGKPDYAAALECGMYGREHPNPQRGDPFAGTGVLSMLYANGQGVERNYDLAVRFTCENPWAAPAENQYRIGHLEQLKTDGGNGKRFDLCDDITSGLSMGACEDVRQSFADSKRQRELDAFVAEQHWDEATQRSFEMLQAAEKTFEKTRTRFEVDLSGTARGMFTLEEQGRLRDQFLINLKRFAKGDLPQTNADGAAHVREQVQAALARIQAAPTKTWEFETIKPDGIAQTQAAWDKVEQAWVEFSKTAFPSLPAEGIRAQLDRLRLHQLQSLLRMA